MRNFSKTLAASLLLAACLPYGHAQTARLEVTGISETSFCPQRGQLVVKLSNAKIATDDDAVSVFINDQPVPQRSIRVADQSVTLDYDFVDGVNDLLVQVVAKSGERLRADAILWAGSNSLIVDLVNADMQPLSQFDVVVALADNTSVRRKQTSKNGSARFDNLPSAALLVSASGPHKKQVSHATRGDAGSLLLKLSE